MKSYHKHLESTLAAGETLSLTRRPVFRSSAIFPVLHSAHYSSRVLFMGYWLLKRHIPEVQMLVTLRGEDGPILLRKSLLITEPKAFALRVGDLLTETTLGNTGTDFTGSLELEIFATRDLVYPYPAFVLNYYGDEFMASVHTTGRVYNDIEDLRRTRIRWCLSAGSIFYLPTNTHRSLPSSMAFTATIAPSSSGLSSMKKDRRTGANSPCRRCLLTPRASCSYATTSTWRPCCTVEKAPSSCTINFAVFFRVSWPATSSGSATLSALPTPTTTPRP